MYVKLLTNNFLSEKAVGKSESKDVHLAVLRVLPEVIRESVDAERHADYRKGEGGKGTEGERRDAGRIVAVNQGKRDGSGVDADASSKSVIVYDPATGEKKMVSPTAVDGIESLGEVKTAEQREAEINARMQDTIQRSKDWLEGNVANPVGMQIQLGDGRIATIEAMHEDGKSAIATLPDGTQFLVPNDVLQMIVNYGQYADYKARRDAEASKREAEQSTESAPETATEGGQPLPEEASPKEEESREYAQGDVFDVVVDGNKMHAEIVSPKDADGRFVVNVDDGESMRTLYVTPEELAAMEYREEPSPKAEETRLATEDSSDKALERGAQPTEEHAPTALERIPRDEKGNAQFHDVDTETAWDGLVEMSGNEETAHKVAEASLANAEKRLKAAKALKEKGDTPEALLQSIKENEKAVAEAEKEVAAWKAIVGEKARREEAAKAEAERIATEKAEAERKAAEERERAEAEEKTRIEAEKKEAERIAAEKAEEEARVEAERKAEEERIAKQKTEEKTEEAESDKEEAEKQMDDEEPKPVGSGVFGNIYNQFKGKVKEAFDFLMKHKGGDLLGVFHRKDVGDIDLVWGDHGGGLAHIIRRHIIEQNDFKNVDEIQKVIEDVIRNGLIVRENKDKINIEYNGYRVSIKKTIRDSKGNVVENKNWIVTAFDKSKPKHEKRNPSSSETLTTPSANQKADGVTLPSNEDSTDKGSKKTEKKQEKQSVFDKAKEIADKEVKKRKAEAEKPKQKPLTEAERKDAEEVAGALGYRVEWVDTMAENGTIDADKKVIRIAKDAENPLVQVLGHEVAHGVKRMDGGKFKALQKAAKEVVGEKEWNERIEKKHKLNAYAEGKLAEEVTCDIVGEALNDKDALKRLAESLRGERGILARLRDAVVRMVEYFKNRGDKEGVRRMKAADKLLAEFESALKEGVAPEQVKPEGVDRSVRESRSEKTELTAEERELRDNLVERMRKGGLDVVTDSEEMQRVIDTENERTRNKRSKKSEAARKRDEALYAVDWSTAFVSGKSREEATEIRRERGRKFKEETKELYGRVLSGNFDDVTLRLIDEFIDKSTPNNPYERPISKRLPTRALQKMRGGERTGSIDALFSRISESAVGKDGKALPRAERERAIEEKKKELLKKWAIATGNWHTDVSDFSDGKEPIGSGTDSDVYLSKDGKSVIKVSKGKPYGKRFRPDVDNVALFNTVFPGSRYTIEGYGEIDGKFVRFLKQPFVDFSDSTPLTEGERVAYMEKLGFKPINKENTAFSNGEIVASDLQKSNVVRDRNGNVRVIDADMKLHTKDVGGNYSYPDVETDTTGLAEREEVNTGSVREHRVYHGSGADFDAFDHSHMGEGEGAQAYGWGTYVTEVEGIGRTYAEQNATTHNDALRALQHDVDAISDQLDRHRDDLKYDEEQLKRANEWRAEAELDYELFKDEAEELKEKYGESSPEYRNHLFNDIYTDEMKRAQSSVKSTEESIQYRKEKIAELEKALKDKQVEIDELPKEFPRHLYTVEIPDDNGSNYLDWNGHPAESLLKGVGSFLESEGFERVQDSPVRYEKGESTVVLNPNATGADLYAELREALGSDKKASQALAELGCIGIKYPADNMRGGRKDGAKNYVIFNENDAKITDHTRFLRTASGEVYGLVKDGRIYLDPKVATAETAVHEYTHLWGDMLRRKDSEQWSHTVKELKNSVLWEEVKELYPELKTDDEIADEVLSTFSGRRGAERLREEARRVADGEGGVFTKAKAIETLERVKEAIARFWEGVARMFGINRYRSAEELADMAMRDLINGVKPTSRTFTFDNFYKDTKAVFEGTERPKGKPNYTSYSGSEYWYGEDKGGKYVVRGSDHWSGEFKVKDGERTNVGRNHYSEITEDGMLPIGAQGSLKFGWEKGLSKPVGSGISAAIDRRGSGDSNNIASCYWYIDNAKEKDNKGFTYGKAYLSEFEDKERRRDIPGDDWRDIQGLEGGTRAMAERIAEQPVEEINNRFNEELEKYQNNELPKGHRFELGMPSAELQSAGFPTLPISMRSSLLAKKAGAERHPFAPTDLRDLVNAIQKPIAIFNYSKNNMRNLIVDVSRGGKHFLVGVTLNYKADNIEINSVSGLFPKENHEWIKWIQDGKVLRIDQKEKVQDLINSLRTNPAESERIGLNLDDVAKKVKDFENPKLL